MAENTPWLLLLSIFKLTNILRVQLLSICADPKCCDAGGSQRGRRHSDGPGQGPGLWHHHPGEGETGGADLEGNLVLAEASCRLVTPRSVRFFHLSISLSISDRMTCVHHDNTVNDSIGEIKRSSQDTLRCTPHLVIQHSVVQSKCSTR